MKCSCCRLKAEFTCCICDYSILCSSHTIAHLKQPGIQHIIEPLDVSLSTQKSELFKIEVLRRVQELEKYIFAFKRFNK